MRHLLRSRAVSSSIAIAALSISMSLVACGGDEPATAQAAKADAAKPTAPPEPTELEKKIAERKAERLAKEKAKKEAEDKRNAAIDALIVQPDKKPRGRLERVCKTLAKSHDAFMLRNYEGATIEKWNGAKKMQLAQTTKMCHGQTIEAAACQIHALDNAPKELKNALPDFLGRCIEKFGKKPEVADGN